MSISIDYKEFSRKLIKIMRGDLSQGQINEKLGKEFNIVHKWEAGKNRIHWLDFVELCTVLNIELGRTLLYCFQFSADSKKPADIFNHFSGGKSPSVLARETGLSRTKIIRRKNGEEVLLSEIFLMMNLYYPSRMWNFLQGLNLRGSDPLIEQELLKLSAASSVMKAIPASSLIFAYLGLGSYKHGGPHSNEKISADLGIPIEEVNMSLKLFEEKGTIEFNGSHFELIDEQLYLKDDIEGIKNTFKYLSERSLERITQDCESNWEDSYRFWMTLDLDEETYEKAKELSSEFLKSLCALTAQRDKDKSCKTRALVFNLFEPVPADIE
ncbi:MAG: hypothetical protein HOE90_21550 [Bacteriovoracaceae bacterium]|jgi:hypothetical protein|nr:hypothetical protein [Bacteriovoracaceae bacterium]